MKCGDARERFIRNEHQEEIMLYPIDLFEKQVREHPDRTAIICADRALTYAQLDEEAGKIAYALQQRGVRAGDLVMVMLPRNSSMLISLLAVLKSGAGYIPVDLDYPKDRIKYIFENSLSKLIICNKDLESAVSYETLRCEGTGTAAPCADRRPTDVCFTVYTSGTTGRPKGVLTSQQAVTNYVTQAPENQFYSHLGRTYNCMLSATTVAFAVFEHEFFGALLHGIPFVFSGDEESKNPCRLADLICRYGADTLSMTPARLDQYLKTEVFREAIASNMKAIMCAGEIFPMSLLKSLRSITDADIYNGYGATELTAMSHEKLLIDEITVGKSHFGYYDDICDEQGCPVPDGEKGELYVGGVGVTLGYNGLDELNREKFFEKNGIRFYKTGDIAVRGKDGEIRILGRKDNQIKLRGLRIEPGEIESLMEEYGPVSRAAVRVKKVRGADHLAAYYVSSVEIDPDDLKCFLAEKLTPYMIPDYFVRMDHFELSPNGKVNTKNLPEIVLKGLDMVPPRSECEKTVFARCAQLIGSDAFGVTDPLKIVGFSSLSLIDVASFVLDAFGTELKLTDMMRDDCTVESICRAIENEADKTERSESNASEIFTLLPSQLPLTIQSWRNQIFRKLTFPGKKDSARLRAAVVRAVNASRYLSVRFSEKNGVFYQQPSGYLLTEADIQICPGEPTEENNREFFRMFEIGDFPLYEFRIYEGTDGCILLFRMHHALFDHGCANTFFERIVKAYNEPDAAVCERVSYFDYLSDIESKREKLLKKSEVLAEEYASQADIRKAPCVKDYIMTYSPAALPAACTDAGNLMLAAVGNAVGEHLGMNRFLIWHTFGGRNEAKYLRTMGFFPYRIPMLFDLSRKASQDDVRREVLKSIEDFSPFDDVAGLRLLGRTEEMVVSFNYLETRAEEKDAEYKLEYVAFEGLPESEVFRRTVAHLDFNCFVKNGKGMFSLGYDTSLFTVDDAEAILKKAVEYAEAGF